MVVARYHQHATMGGGSIGGAVFQGVAGSVHARALAIPEAEYALYLTVFIGFYLLGTQHDRRGKILVDGGDKIDPVLVEQVLGLPERLVNCTER